MYENHEVYRIILFAVHKKKKKKDVQTLMKYLDRNLLKFQKS